jgi:Protein of unknown function (DUF1501)
VHVHDLNAKILQCLGIDHTRLTYKYQGRGFRLTDVHSDVVKQIFALREIESLGKKVSDIGLLWAGSLIWRRRQNRMFTGFDAAG